jgi:histidine triad (HIT) family protein
MPQTRAAHDCTLGDGHMSLTGGYDRNNVFARIISGELPCHRVHEDRQFLAFMDKFPQSRGHLLVIPKLCEARNILELDSEKLAGLFSMAQRLARAVTEALTPDGVQIFQMNGTAAGQTVFHIHVHVIPRWSGVEPGFHRAKEADDSELADLATLIASHVR